MILPNKQTPASRCEELGRYTEHMLAKFPENPRLVALSQRLRDGTSALESAGLAYDAERRVLARLRIDVDFENYLADQRVRRTRKLVEMHDGRRGGRLAAQILPDGSLDFSRIQGARQIDAMRSLETRLAAVRDLWPEAESERAAIETHRVRYAGAVGARDEGLRRTKDLRLGRDAAKERFLQLYAEIVSLVAAEFPRDRDAQELFFLDARKPGRVSDDDGDELPDDELPGDEPLVGPAGA